MGENELPFYIIFTKADKISKTELNQNINSVKKKLLEYWTELPPIFTSSTLKKIGRDDILAHIKMTIDLL